MPNWCDNHVVIYGEKETLNEILEAMKDNSRNTGDEDLSFLDTFLPMSAYHKTIEGFNDGGYEWAIDTWGTKWPENEMGYAPLFDFGMIPSLHLNFASPWGPPLDGYIKISKMFPNLFFTHIYDEPGMGYAGVAIYKNGDMIEEQEVGDDDYPCIQEDDFMSWQEEVNDMMDRMADYARDYVYGLNGL